MRQKLKEKQLEFIIIITTCVVYLFIRGIPYLSIFLGSGIFFTIIWLEIIVFFQVSNNKSLLMVLFLLVLSMSSLIVGAEKFANTLGLTAFILFILSFFQVLLEKVTD